MTVGGIEVTTGYIYYTKLTTTDNPFRGTANNGANPNEVWKVGMTVLGVAVGLGILGAIIFLLIRRYRNKQEASGNINSAAPYNRLTSGEHDLWKP